MYVFSSKGLKVKEWMFMCGIVELQKYKNRNVVCLLLCHKGTKAQSSMKCYLITILCLRALVAFYYLQVGFLRVNMNILDKKIKGEWNSFQSPLKL